MSKREWEGELVPVIGENSNSLDSEHIKTIAKESSEKARIIDRLSADASFELSVGADLLSHLPSYEQVLFWSYGEGPAEPLPFVLIHQAIEQRAQETPNARAVVYDNSSISYAVLNTHANALAEHLINIGVRPGDVVPLFLERSTSMVVGILAILKIGASYAPQHVGVAPDAQLTHVVNQVNASVVLTLSKYSERVHACTLLPCIAVDEFELKIRKYEKKVLSDNPRPLPFPANPVAMVLFTSGTTGKPNGVKVTHHNLCNILLTSPGNLGIGTGTTVGQILSIAFDMAAWEILGCLSNGGTLLIRGKDIALTASQANVIIATPSILSRIPLEECSFVKTVAVAGEPCPRKLADDWSKKTRFYNSCGPTETTIVNTMLAHSASYDVLSIGKPTPNNTVYVLDGQGKPCRIGEIGEMWGGGNAVTAGYLNNPQLTHERYRDDPFLGGKAKMFNTRDLGRWTKDGTLEHLGRTDDQVKIRGFRVELDSISSVLEAQETCNRATALKFDDRTIIAFMSPLSVDSESARNAVAAALPYFCIPSEIHKLPELPLTSRGKIDKKILLDAAKHRQVNHACKQEAQFTEQMQTSGKRNHSCDIEGKNTPITQAPLKNRPDSDISHNNNHIQHNVQQTDLTQTRLNKHELRSDELISLYQRQTLPETPNTLAAKLTHHRFYHYWRLVTFVAVVNVFIIGHAVYSADWWDMANIRIDWMLNMTVANLTVAIVFRQQYVVNILFRIATSMPLSAPLGLRQLMGKVYHFGGVHVGGAVFGTIWMLLSLISMFVIALSSAGGAVISGTTLLASSQLLLVLTLLVALAYPRIRQRFHNQFELVHRLGGWFSLAMFWIVSLSFLADNHVEASFGAALLNSPVVWALSTVSCSILLPWLRLQRIPVKYERPSDHVVLAKFDYGVTPFAGSSTTLSRSPLTEWHSFANVPAPGKNGYRLTISRAGDWTGRLIDEMPSHLWVKGIPTAGVGNVDQLFKRVVWIATGSGIGPTLPHLLAKQVPAHLVWSTRNARKTYGDDLVDEIIKVEPNALIWDTDKHGRPDLVQIAYAAVQNFHAEAVIVIANEKLTRMVVHNMEARGIPAYGAIWDS